MSMINRRMLVASAVAAAATLSAPRNVFAQSPAPGPFVQPPLPFLEPQLAPTISNRTVTLHFSRGHERSGFV